MSLNNPAYLFICLFQLLGSSRKFTELSGAASPELMLLIVGLVVLFTFSMQSLRILIISVQCSAIMKICLLHLQYVFFFLGNPKQYIDIYDIQPDTIRISQVRACLIMHLFSTSAVQQQTHRVMRGPYGVLQCKNTCLQRKQYFQFLPSSTDKQTRSAVTVQCKEAHALKKKTLKKKSMLFSYVTIILVDCNAKHVSSRFCA